MPCNQNCNQGRDCNCDRSLDRATVVVVTLLMICVISLCFGFYKLIYGTKGQDCAINVKFKDHTAMYVGKSI